MKCFLKKVFQRISPLPKSGFIEIKKSGFKWRINLESCVGKSIAENGVWEPKTTDVVQKIVKPGMYVLDIGANFGYYTVLMAQIIGPEGKIWAFEPVKKFREQLKWHIDHNEFNDRVVVVPYGLSDEVNRIPISIDESSATLYWVSQEPAPSHEIIQLKRLDDEIRDLNITKIDFIKIDVDGNEPKFLRGARETLIKHRPIEGVAPMINIMQDHK